MLTQSTPTSISDLAQQEGTALLFAGGPRPLLFAQPEGKIVVTAKRGCWEELDRQIGPNTLAVGYLGYEMGAFADADREASYHASSIPDALFYLYSKKRLLELPLPQKALKPLQLASASDSQESYLAKIAQIQEWIRAGDVYQVNLSQEWVFEGETDPFALFCALSQGSPPPHSAYLNCGQFSIVSASPELFCRSRNGLLETRPIKGTAPRGATREEDALFKAQLLASEKERAELLMITDLMRHDLAKISSVGSVKVRGLWQCEEYADVFHLLSIIEGTRKAGISPTETLRSLYPAGSITGCPKLSAIEAIHALEKRARGVYTGAIGYFDGEEGFDFNVAIRTLLVQPGQVRVQLGGGIVADSDPMKEYEETLHKGRSIFRVCSQRYDHFS